MPRVVVSVMVFAGFLFVQATQISESAALSRSITRNQKILTVFRNDPPGPLNRYLFGGGVFGLFSRPPGKFVMEIEGGVEIKGKQELNWMFSSDLTRYAFVNFFGTGFQNVLDGQPSEKYWRFKGPVFSPDGTSCSFVALRYKGFGFNFAKKWDLVFGSETKGPFEDAEPLHYSRDGRRSSYAVKENAR